MSSITEIYKRTNSINAALSIFSIVSGVSLMVISAATPERPDIAMYAAGAGFITGFAISMFIRRRIAQTRTAALEFASSHSLMQLEMAAMEDTVKQLEKDVKNARTPFTRKPAIDATHRANVGTVRQSRTHRQSTHNYGQDPALGSVSPFSAASPCRWPVTDSDAGSDRVSSCSDSPRVHSPSGMEAGSYDTCSDNHNSGNAGDY